LASRGPLRSFFAHRRAAALHAQGLALSEDGDGDGALRLYERALELHPDRAQTLYNVGLIHKYRRNWLKSFAYNHEAFERQPGDEATRWNLAIAATALGDWATARRVWRLCGYDVGEGEGPIEADFGLACVRLNPDDAAEVVWVTRIDPVRGRIDNIPFPDSGFFHGDIVLHDGAANGRKQWDETEYPIFDAFERVARSPYSVAAVEFTSPSDADVQVLRGAFAAADMYAEDWTANVAPVCKACSEGTTHAFHDTDLALWQPDRSLGVALVDEARLEDVLARWADGPGRAIASVTLTS
jgi:tetratricopeptide (TPR) repeat protein